MPSCKGLEQRLDMPIYLLENVLGVRKVLPQIQDLLHKKLPNHLHSTVTINAKSLGDPVSRRRLYFVGIRRPAAINTTGSFKAGVGFDFWGCVAQKDSYKARLSALESYESLRGLSSSARLPLNPVGSLPCQRLIRTGSCNSNSAPLSRKLPAHQRWHGRICSWMILRRLASQSSSAKSRSTTFRARCWASRLSV